MAEEKKTWWKWAAGAYLANAYIDSKIEKSASEIEEEVSRRVGEELDKRERKKEEEAHYSEVQQQTIKKKRAEDKKKEAELNKKEAELRAESSKLGKELKKKFDPKKFNELIDVMVNYADATSELFDFYIRRGIEIKLTEKNLLSYIQSIYSIVFKTAIGALGATFNTQKNKSDISKEKLKIFNDMLAKWGDKELISKKDYKDFLNEINDFESRHKAESIKKILGQIEEKINLKTNIKKIDGVINLVTERMENAEIETSEIIVTYEGNDLVLQYRDAYTAIRLIHLLTYDSITCNAEMNGMHVDLKDKEKVMNILSKYGFKYKLIRNKDETSNTKNISKEKDKAKKSRITAGILAILLGGLGFHKFYLKKVGIGLLYIFFCWTFVPSIIGIFEGINYLRISDKDFEEKYCNIVEKN